MSATVQFVGLFQVSKTKFIVSCTNVKMNESVNPVWWMNRTNVKLHSLILSPAQNDTSSIVAGADTDGGFSSLLHVNQGWRAVPLCGMTYTVCTIWRWKTNANCPNCN